MRIRIYGGQIYVFNGRGRNEKSTKMLDCWSSRCAACGRKFESRTEPGPIESFSPSRRCRECASKQRVARLRIEIETSDFDPLL